MWYIYLKVPTTLPSYMIICKLNFSPFWTIYSAFRCTKVRVTGARDGIRIRVWRCEWRKGRRGHYKIPLCPTRFFFFLSCPFFHLPHRIANDDDDDGFCVFGPLGSTGRLSALQKQYHWARRRAQGCGCECYIGMPLVRAWKTSSATGE